jgi:hypothetical protein
MKIEAEMGLFGREVSELQHGSGAADLGACRCEPAGIPDPMLALGPGDFYFDLGLMVFSGAYHLRRGYCCGNGCRHCPYPIAE